MNKYVVTFEAQIRKDFVFNANSKEDAITIAKDSMTKVLEAGNILIKETNIQAIQKKETILYADNGHNRDLVDKINFLWNVCKERFKPIIGCLLERDIVEYTEKFNCDAKSALLQDWEEIAFNYLSRVSDDTDLEVIINFISYYDKEKKQYILANSEGKYFDI